MCLRASHCLGSVASHLWIPVDDLLHRSGSEAQRGYVTTQHHTAMDEWQFNLHLFVSKHNDLSASQQGLTEHVPAQP